MHQLKNRICQSGSENVTKLYAVCWKTTLNIDKHSLKVSGGRKIHHTNTNPKKAGEAILISDKTDFKAMKVVGHTEEHYIMIKGSSLQKI